MNAMSPCPKDSPLMIAWEAHKATDDFKNIRNWATRYLEADDPAELDRIRASGANPVTRQIKEQYVEGSLWAQFSAGFLAADPHGAVRPSEPSQPADRREIVARINAAIAKLTFMTHGKIGQDWRSSRQFVLPEKGNEWDALLDAIELLRDARSAILAALDGGR